MQIATSGGRRVTPAALHGRRLRVEEERGVSRKEISAAAREAEKALNLRPTLRLVLQELVGCWGEKELKGRLLVWPSNDYLIDRTGLSERAVRLAIARLVELQLIAARDSANGKRFAIRNAAGEIIDAYGFDLSPLIARHAEFAGRVLALKQQRDAQARGFDDITIARRATEEALRALRESFPDASTSDLESALESLRLRTPRRGSMTPLDELIEAYQAVREMAEQRLYEHGNAGNSCRHIETNNESSGEACNKGLSEKSGRVPQTERSVDLALLRDACPALLEYGQEIRGRSDLLSVARFLRPSIGAHESAFTEAVDKIGAEMASAALVYVLQIHTEDAANPRPMIQNPGGYYRALTRLIAEGRFNLNRELLAKTSKRKRPAD